MENKLFDFAMGDSTFELIEEIIPSATGDTDKAETSYLLREKMTDKSEMEVFRIHLYDKGTAYRLATILRRIYDN